MKSNSIKTIVILLLISIIFIFINTVSNTRVKKLKGPPTTHTRRSNTIPKIVFQTYKSYDKVPVNVKNNIKQYAKEYQYKFYSDKACYNFIKNNYSSSILNVYKHLRGAHRADLVRYCLLYKYGGIYIDIKTELIKPLKDIFTKNYTYTCICWTRIAGRCIYQGIIATTKGNPLFLKLIKFIEKTHKDSNKNYHIYTEDFFNNIKKLLPVNNNIKEGLNITKRPSDDNIYLFQELCDHNPDNCYDGLDRYGLCCHVYDKGEKIFKTRYSSYPW